MIDIEFRWLMTKYSSGELSQRLQYRVKLANPGGWGEWKEVPMVLEAGT